MAPLGMGVGPAQACVVKVVVTSVEHSVRDGDPRFAGGDGVTSKLHKQSPCTIGTRGLNKREK